MRVVISATLFLAFAALAHGEPMAVRGAGASTCAAYASYAETYKSNPSEANTYLTWAQGFMSGLNYGHLRTKDTLDLNPQALQAFPIETQGRLLQQYCEQHPTMSFSAAVFALWVEMRKSQGLSAGP
jgi:hypothetical protein